MRLTNLHNEQLLLQKIAESDEASFAEIYEVYSDPLNQFVLKYVKSKELSNDIIQEVFIRIWEHRSELPEIDSFKAYLFTIARNLTLNFLKKASRQNAVIAEIARNYKPVACIGEDRLLSNQYKQFIEEVLQSLPPQTRTVFRLCREEEKSYDEVAACLGISRNAVKKHIVRSHKFFKEQLLDHPDLQFGILFLLFLKS